jgi:toxin CcdB
MAQFDVFTISGSRNLLIDLQSSRVDHLTNRVVAPLVPPEEYGQPFDRLTPIFVIDGDRYVMLTQFLGAVQIGELRTKIANLEHEQFRIKAAIDVLVFGV